LRPTRSNLRGLQEGLHYNTILFRLLFQCCQLFRSRLRGLNIKLRVDVLKANRNFFRNPKRTAQIHLTFNLDANVLERNSHRSRNKLASQLRTSCESAEQQVTRTGCSAGTTDTAVCLCFEYLLSDFN